MALTCLIVFSEKQAERGYLSRRVALDTNAPELLGFFSKSKSVLGFEAQWGKGMPDSRVSV